MKISQLSGCIALSAKQTEDFSYYAPHYGIHSYRNPGELINCELPEVDVGVLANWLEEEDYAWEEVPEEA